MAEAPSRQEEAGPRLPLELTVQLKPTLINLKIGDRLLAGGALVGIGIGCVAMGVLFYKIPELFMSAVKGALEGPELQVLDIATGSILVKLQCATIESFLSFMKDFEEKKVKQRLEVEFKKIGFEGELEVTITNDKEVYEKLDHIRKNEEAIMADGDIDQLIGSILNYKVGSYEWFDDTRPSEMEGFRLNIVFYGMAGSGKSALINNIFESLGLSQPAVTQTTGKEGTTILESYDLSFGAVTFYDTRGFRNLDEMEQGELFRILDGIQRPGDDLTRVHASFQKAAAAGVGAHSLERPPIADQMHVIVWVMKANDIRFEQGKYKEIINFVIHQLESETVPVITVITFDDEVQKMPNPDEERKKLEKAAIEVTGSEKRNVFFIANSVTDQEDLASAYRKRLLQMVKQALKCGELSIKMRQNQRETPEKMKRYSRSESKPGVRPLRFPGEKTESPAINYLSEESSREAHDTNVDGTVQERKEASQREARWLENERRQREFEEKQRIEREKREKEEEQGRRAYQQKRVREIADEEKRLKLEHELCVRRDELKNYKFGVKTRLDSFRGLLIDDVTQLRIGLFGQTGSGKRCFINTCERTVRETEKGSAPDSTTGQEGTIILQDYLPEMFFRLVDIRGFFNYNADEYVEFEDILLGRLQPGDNVKRPKEGQADTPPMDLYQNTQFANRLHGVIYVVMANDARLREGHLKNYLKPVRYILRESGIAPITVVTHRDKLNTEEECENALFEASAATGSSPSHTFFVANYTKDRPKRDPKTERIIFDILHCALLMAERAVKIMKQKIKNKEEDEMMRRLEGTSVSGQVAPDSPEASVEVFLRFLQKEYQWSTNSVKQVVNKLSKDDVTSVQLLAIFWRDVQTHFPFGMRKMVGKELRNRNMIP